VFDSFPELLQSLHSFRLCTLLRRLLRAGRWTALALVVSALLPMVLTTTMLVIPASIPVILINGSLIATLHLVAPSLRCFLRSIAPHPMFKAGQLAALSLVVATVLPAAVVCSVPCLISTCALVVPGGCLLAVLPPTLRLLHSLFITLPYTLCVRVPHVVGCMIVLSSIVVHRALTKGLNNYYADFLERHPFLVVPLLPLLPLVNRRTKGIVLASSLCTSSLARVNTLHAQATEAVSAGATIVHETLDRYISDPINRGLERVEAVVERVGSLRSMSWEDVTFSAASRVDSVLESYRIEETVVSAVDCAVVPGWWWSKITIL